MDPERYDSLVRSIYEGVLAPAGWHTVLDDLRTMLGCEQATYLVHHRPSQRTLVAEIAQLDLGFIRQYETQYEPLDPVRPAVDAMPEGQWFIDERELGATTKGHSDFYQDFLRPYGLGAIICTPLINSGPTLAGLAFQSGTDDSRQGQAKARMLDPLLAHLQCAARLRIRFHELARRAELGKRLLDRFSIPLMIINVRSHILFGNTAAEHWLKQGGSLSDRICTARRSVRRADLDKLAAAICGPSSAAMPATIQLSGPDGAAIMVGLPLAASHPMSVDFHEPVGMIAILAPDRATASGIALLRDLYGLSAAELRLVQAWTNADSLYDAAAVLNLSRDTVRTQIKAVFRKTGCAN